MSDAGQFFRRAISPMHIVCRESLHARLSTTLFCCGLAYAVTGLWNSQKQEE